MTALLSDVLIKAKEGIIFFNINRGLGKRYVTGEMLYCETEYDLS